MEQGQRTGVGAASSARTQEEGRSKSSGKGVNEALTQAKETAQQAGRQASEAASSLARKANEEALKLADRQVDVGADMVASVAASVRAAAESLEQDIPQLSNLVRGAAEQIDDFAESIRSQSTREIMDRAAALARRRPAIVLGAAAASGFLLFRLLRTPPDSQSDEDLDGRREELRNREYGLDRPEPRGRAGSIGGGSGLKGETTHGGV